MSEQSMALKVHQAASGVLTPTGWELLALVKFQGDYMMKQPTHEAYLVERDAYLDLLVLAERDAICAPILITAAQRALDEDVRRARDKG